VFVQLSCLIRFTSTIAGEFCAGTNTGSDFQSGNSSRSSFVLKLKVFSLYQSVGACTGTCTGFAFAILQDHVLVLVNQ
jgi:hypothetical protein